MSRFQSVSEPSIIPAMPAAPDLAIPDRAEDRASMPATGRTSGRRPRRTLTGAIGALFMFPLRAIIGAFVALGVHPNLLTLTGVIINAGAAWALGHGRFILAFVIMLAANTFDFIDGKVAHQL